MTAEAKPGERALSTRDSVQKGGDPVDVATVEARRAFYEHASECTSQYDETFRLAAKDVLTLLDGLERRACHHGWRGQTPEDGRRIVTPCPACGSQSLFIGSGGHLTCANLHCSEPGVARQVERLREDLGALAMQAATLREACTLVLELADAEPAARRQLRGLRLLVRQKVEKALAEEVKP